MQHVCVKDPGQETESTLECQKKKLVNGAILSKDTYSYSPVYKNLPEHITLYINMSPEALNHFVPVVKKLNSSITKAGSGDSLQGKGLKLSNDKESQCRVILGEAFYP